MTIGAVIQLIVALCRFLEVPPEELAEFFNQYADNQGYFDVLLEAQQATKGD